MSDNPLPPNALGRPKDMAKRQAILDAAKTLFLTKGYASTSMDAVASLAGVSKLTVYSHFTDKETLFSSGISTVERVLTTTPPSAPLSYVVVIIVPSEAELSVLGSAVLPIPILGAKAADITSISKVTACGRKTFRIFQIFRILTS